MNVLVVEDDAAVRHVLDRSLTGAGHNVVLASSSVEAEASLIDWQLSPDVFVIDLGLPGVNGVRYAVQLRPRFPSARYLFITGWLIDNPQVAEAEAIGRVLFKPFTVATLQSAIDSEN